MDLSDHKSVLRHYLQDAREALLWKLEGLPERELRLPRTPTGTNLLGIVKHMANVEIGYFGDTFGHVWPDSTERVAEAVFATDPQADWYATEGESAAEIIGLYRRVWAFADKTIEETPLDGPGRVPWWPEERNHVTLGLVITHVLTDLARHCGHADILREGIDGAVGMITGATNIPDDTDWPAYVAKLEAIADRY